MKEKGDPRHVLASDRMRPNHEGLIIINDPPYGTDKAYNAPRLAHALVKNDSDAERAKPHRWAGPDAHL